MTTIFKFKNCKSVKYMLVLPIALTFVACKNDYTCVCYYTSRFSSEEVYRGEVKAYKKGNAGTLCQNDFENSPKHVKPSYCEVK